jgi:hypothetical protein
MLCEKIDMIAADSSGYYQKLKSGGINPIERGVLYLLERVKEPQSLKLKLRKFFYRFN